jgi:ABC-type transport system involved in Fe-S cluster assembly fused permease/ATPase subunit
MKENNISLPSVLMRLFSYLWAPEWEQRIRIFISLGLTFVMMAIRLGTPFIFKNVVNFLSDPNAFSTNLIALVLVGYGLSWILDYAITQIRTLIIFKVLERCLRVLSLSVLDHLLSLSLRFHLDSRTGALTNYIYRLQNGFDTVFWGFFSFLIPTFLEMAIVIILVGSLYGWSYSGVLMMVVLGYNILNVFGMRKSLVLQELHNTKRTHTSARIVDSLFNYETIKYFNNENYELDQINSALSEQEAAGLKRSTVDIYLQLSQSILIGIGFACLTWWSGQAVVDGLLTLGDFVLINGLLMQFIMPLNHLGSLIYQIRKGLYDIHSTMNVLFLKPEVKDAVGAKNISLNKVDLEFDHVSFGYVSERKVLKNLSFNISAGKRIAIVGTTGSGKSTIARLIFRFYDIQSGCIKVNGEDIRHLSQQSLRNAIGIVPQDTVLFNDTLYYNITYGNPHASIKEVESVVAFAQLDAFIHSLPEGYQTVVGERGLKLSGGEKQRIAIARVLLKKPKLFIFDEATSSLDTLTEREIQKSLYKISSGITTIIIAHRLSTVIQADEIYVLEEGQIVERGTHQELLLKEGRYFKMWREQHTKMEKNETLNYQINTKNLDLANEEFINAID